MPDRLNAWLVLDRTWRSAVSALWRFPLLLLLCWAGDVLASSYAFKILPVAAANEMAVRIFDQAAYVGLNALFAALPITAVMLMVIKGRVRHSELWSKPASLVGMFQLGRGLLYLALLIPFWFWSFHDGALIGRLYVRGAHFLAFVLWFLSHNLWYLLVMLVWARLVLILPAAILDDGSPRPALRDGWRMTKGHYGLALAATIMVTVPWLVLENIIDIRFYRPLGDTGIIPTGLTAHQWERLMIRSGEVLFKALLDGAMAAWLYHAVLARTKSPGQLDALSSKGTAVPFSSGMKAQ